MDQRVLGKDCGNSSRPFARGIEERINRINFGNLKEFRNDNFTTTKEQTMKKIIMVIALGLSAVSCGESKNVQWIDTGFAVPIGHSCDELEDKLKKDKQARKEWETLFPAMCGQHGKTYANEWRCKDNRLQFKCE